MKIIVRNKEAFVVENPRIDGEVIRCTLHPLAGDVSGCDSGDEATYYRNRWLVKGHHYPWKPPVEAVVICSTCGARRLVTGDEPCVTYAGKVTKSHRTRLAPLDGYG